MTSMHALAFRSPKANRMFHHSLRSRNVAMLIGRTSRTYIHQTSRQWCCPHDLHDHHPFYTLETIVDIQQ